MSVCYDIDLILLSGVVATLGSYLAIRLAERMRLTQGYRHALWLTGGAVALGIATLTLQCIALMSARPLFPAADGLKPRALALLIAISTSALALALIGGQSAAGWGLIAAALVLATGTFGMYATEPGTTPWLSAVLDSPARFATFGVASILAALLALWLAGNLQSKKPGTRGGIYLVLTSLVMGTATIGMHYAAMAASLFAPSGHCLADLPFGNDDTLPGHALAAVALVLLALTLFISFLEAHRHDRATNLAQRIIDEAAIEARAQKRLRESEEKYRVLFDTTTDAVIMFDAERRIRLANRAVSRVFGYSPEELMGQDVSILRSEESRPTYNREVMRLLDTGKKLSDGPAITVKALKRDGTPFPIEVIYGEVSLGEERMFAIFARDISEREERELRIQRLSHFHAVLSGINGLSVRARSRQELFDGACRIAVEGGRFLVAEIVTLQGEQIKMAATFGVSPGDVEKGLEVAFGRDDFDARGPEHLVRVCNDIAAEPEPGQWRNAALELGYRSSISLPLLENGQLTGRMYLYAGEVGVFDDEEIKLLTDLARNISYSIDFIARDEKLDYLGYYDPLTKLANASFFKQRLEQFIFVARQERQQLAVLYIDLSGFKAINDEFGQSGGDAVLRILADRLLGFVVEPSHAARMAGDRFAVVVPNFKASASGSSFAYEQLSFLINRPLELDGHELRLTFRMGVAVFPGDGDDAGSLLRNAETALKAARSAVSGYLQYTREMGARVGEKLSMSGRLRQALDRQEFVLFYQPKVSLATGRISGAEALIRWMSPDLGLVLPNRFIPLLEETGLILEVGRWALLQASRDYQSWHAAGFGATRIAVNISAVQLKQPDFLDTVRSLQETANELRGIDLEVTESVLMSHVEQHIKTLQILKNMGISIAIDDFGTGYSSLAYLNKLPISTLKIDRSFIVEMGESKTTRNIVSTIISLAHSMNLTVVAEGVKSTQQLTLLRQLNCDELQGFIFSRAIPAADFAALLKSDRRLPLPEKQRSPADDDAHRGT